MCLRSSQVHDAVCGCVCVILLSVVRAEPKSIPSVLSGSGYPSQIMEETLSPSTTDSLTKTTLSPETDNQSDTASVTSSLKRPHRPPDLDLTSLNLTPIQHQDITIHTSGPPTSGGAAGTREASVEGRTSRRSEASHGSAAVQPDFDPTRSSTPTTAATKMSGSVSERVSLVPISYKPCEWRCIHGS